MINQLDSWKMLIACALMQKKKTQLEEIEKIKNFWKKISKKIPSKKIKKTHWIGE